MRKHKGAPQGPGEESRPAEPSPLFPGEIFPAPSRMARMARSGRRKPLSPPELFIAYLLLVAIFLSLSGYLLFRREYRRILEAQSRELASIGGLKASMIEHWRGDFFSAAFFTSRMEFQPGDVPDARDDLRGAAVRSGLVQSLGLHVRHGDFDEAALYSLEGELLAVAAGQARAAPRRLDGEAMAIARQALETGGFGFRDLYRRPDGGYGVDILTPVRDREGRSFAVLVAGKDPERDLFPMLRAWPVPSATGESFLTRLEEDRVVILSPLRFEEIKPLEGRFSVQDIRSSGQRRAPSPGIRFFEGRDHRGVEVISDSRTLEGLPWYLITKMDASEALEMARIHGFLIAGGAFILFLLAGAGLAAFLLRNRKDFYRDLYRREQKQVELLREYGATLLSIGEGVVSTDSQGRIKWLNTAAEKLTGWPQAEARGRPLPEILDMRDEATGKRVPNPAQTIMKTGVRMAAPRGRVLVSRDGREHPLIGGGAPIRDEDGRIDGAVLIFQDISDRRRKEGRIRMLSDIVQGSLNEVLVFDAGSLRFTYANPAALSNLGYSFGELMRMTPLDIKPEFTPESFAALLDPLRSGQSSPVQLVTRHRRKDGSTYDIFLAIEPFRGPSGNSFISIGLDYTERSKLEADLRRSLAERETLLRELHHRTKNNLQVVSSLLSLESSRRDDASVRASLGDMEKRVGAMALAHERLYQSRSLSSLELGPYLESILRLCLEAYDSGPRIRHRLEAPKIAVSVEVASPLGLIVTELATNTAKHGYPDGGPGSVLLRLEREGEGELRLHYRDDGVGLPPDHDPGGGEHLGMVLIRTLAEHQLRGRYLQETGPGFSCTVSVGLPLGAGSRGET